MRAWLHGILILLTSNVVSIVSGQVYVRCYYVIVRGRNMFCNNNSVYLKDIVGMDVFIF